MKILKRLFTKYHEKWAVDRFNFFIKTMSLDNNDTILDLGGGDGSYMDRFGDTLRNYSVIIADISEDSIEKASNKGYSAIVIDGSSNNLPFDDHEIDCIFCNSVIEHITIPKDQLWSDISNSSDFSKSSFIIQQHFASEIIRCAKKYYVQTPHKYFPIEAHTWFPFIGYLNRRTQLKLIKFLNTFWVKKTEPDWNLLTEKDMKKLFPDAGIFVFKKFGFKKEIIAIKK
jgi:2-polyprenyl-3-methyl-5-hydroxy-6-metoxy-1,4-benzoquinol methylase